MTSLPSIDRDPHVLQPHRALVGHCPNCSAVVVVVNDHESWPYIVCRCGHGFDTLGIADRVRYEAGVAEVNINAIGAVLHRVLPATEADYVEARIRAEIE